MPDHRFGPSQDELNYLSRTADDTWSSVWIQGRRPWRAGKGREGFYNLYQTTFVGERRLRISRQEVLPPYGHHYYWVSCIAVDEDPDFGKLEYEKRYRSRRQALEEFPADLDMTPFLLPGRGYEILSSYDDALIDGAYETSVIDIALLITAKTGERMLFTLDEEDPKVVLVTQDSVQIEAAITRAQFVRSSFERVREG